VRESDKPIYEFGAFRLDAMQYRLLQQGEPVSLAPKEFDMLLVLVERRGQVVSKDDLLKTVWPDTIVEETNLTVIISALRKALGESTAQKYIETIPKRGYRFVAPVREIGHGASELVVAEHIRSSMVIEEEETEDRESSIEIRASTPSAPALPLSPRWRWSPAAVALSLLVTGLLAALLFVWTKDRSNPPETGVIVKSIAVLPFKPLSADAGDEYLGLGMADTLITRLSNLQQLIVRPTSAVRKYSSPEQDPLAAGREQQVDAVLEGSIQRSGEKIRVTVRLLDVTDGKPLWAHQSDEQQTDLFAVQDAICEEVTQALMLKLTVEQRQRLTKRYTENAKAYQLYLRGRYHWDKGTTKETKKATEYFQQAITLDPNYTLAYTGLADAYFFLHGYGAAPPREVMPKAKAAVSRALELDETLAEAHTSQGLIKHMFDWDFAGAEQAFKRGIEINPNSATAHHLYGKCVADTGRFNESLAALKRALELDPYSLSINKDLGEVLYYARSYDDAIEQFQKTLQLEPNYPVAYFWLARAYEATGLYDQAVAADLRSLSVSGVSPERVVALKKVYAASGWKGYWQRHLEALKGRAGQEYDEPYRMVELYARLGETEQALDWLEKAYQERSSWLLTIKNDPALDSLRSDLRFQELQRRVGFQ
jgi:DNA-binding winged helix-turn-helix (wHTH) protein/TolB-like protein/cytochrome c-type biogenesis protein CcmH/NrfG